MKKIGIYKLENPKGAVYVGQSVDIDARYVKYRRMACKGQKKLYASLNKYGFEAHKFEIIEECSVEMLNDRERYWQDFYNVLSENGLNLKLTNSADKSGYFSEEIKSKMRGLSRTNLQRENMSQAQKKLFNSGYIHPMQGIEKSNITKEKISNSLKEKYKKGEIKCWNKGIKTNTIPSNAKIVLDLETGFFYYSASECWSLNREYLKISQKSFDRKLRQGRKNNTKFIYI